MDSEGRSRMHEQEREGMVSQESSSSTVVTSDEEVRRRVEEQEAALAAELDCKNHDLLADMVFFGRDRSLQSMVPLKEAVQSIESVFANRRALLAMRQRQLDAFKVELDFLQELRNSLRRDSSRNHISVRELLRRAAGVGVTPNDVPKLERFCETGEQEVYIQALPIEPRQISMENFDWGSTSEIRLDFRPGKPKPFQELVVKAANLFLMSETHRKRLVIEFQVRSSTHASPREERDDGDDEVMAEDDNDEAARLRETTPINHAADGEKGKKQPDVQDAMPSSSAGVEQSVNESSLKIENPIDSNLKRKRKEERRKRALEQPEQLSSSRKRSDSVREGSSAGPMCAFSASSSNEKNNGMKEESSFQPARIPEKMMETEAGVFNATTPVMDTPSLLSKEASGTTTKMSPSAARSRSGKSSIRSTGRPSIKTTEPIGIDITPPSPLPEAFREEDLEEFLVEEGWSEGQVEEVKGVRTRVLVKPGFKVSKNRINSGGLRKHVHFFPIGSLEDVLEQDSGLRKKFKAKGPQQKKLMFRTQDMITKSEDCSETDEVAKNKVEDRKAVQELKNTSETDQLEIYLQDRQGWVSERHPQHGMVLANTKRAVKIDSNSIEGDDFVKVRHENLCQLVVDCGWLGDFVDFWGKRLEEFPLKNNSRSLSYSTILNQNKGCWNSSKLSAKNTNPKTASDIEQSEKRSRKSSRKRSRGPNSMSISEMEARYDDEVLEDARSRQERWPRRRRRGGPAKKG